MIKKISSLLILLAFLPAFNSAAQTDNKLPFEADVQDPLDPFDSSRQAIDQNPSEDLDKDKSSDELVREATYLLQDERLLDGRSKLLKAIQKDPNNYRAYYMLAGYYTVHVGHFRLALKYIKRAQDLFQKEHGAPPYQDLKVQLEHGQILYYISQIRLNLDNYQGALDAIDEYTRYGYYDSWLPGSRAWILMKLGKLEEAISVARLGVLTGAEPGRTLNMLGILLSMTDAREEALRVFKQAISEELAMGTEGQPATPLNNAGEVYKEIFDEDKAEATWLRSTSLPDGCDHVLPTLNLALLYIDEVQFQAASDAMDRFNRCIAQFPLRNDEEHVALVNMARGRIMMHSGFIDEAIKRFETALQGVQWFGKIGTNRDDLTAASMLSLAQALHRKNNLIALHIPESTWEWVKDQKEMVVNSSRAWWLLRRVRQLMTEEMNNLEDLTVRNTDSMIEYPTFGELLSTIPHATLKRRIQDLIAKEDRPKSIPYYEAYLAEGSLDWLNRNEGIALLDKVLGSVRNKYDSLLSVHISALRMQYLDNRSADYKRLAENIFNLAPAESRNYGLRLPVVVRGPESLSSMLSKGPFIPSSQADCSVEGSKEQTGNAWNLTFSCRSKAFTRTAKHESLPTVVNLLSDAVFKVTIN